MTKARADLSGEKFGRWTVQSLDHIKNRSSYWKCVCECGREKVVLGATLKNGTSASCGCGIGDAARKRLTKHGRAHDKLHYIWTGMKQRCGNPSNKMYHYYGGRGITVCDEWQSFEGFLKDMGDSWAEGLSIDRMDNNKGYCKENCRWIPKSDQAKNRRPSSEWVFKK